MTQLYFRYNVYISNGKSLTQDTTLSYIQLRPFQTCNLCTHLPMYSTVDSRSRVLKMGGLLIVCRHYKTPLNLLISIFTFDVRAYFVESGNFFVKWTPSCERKCSFIICLYLSSQTDTVSLTTTLLQYFNQFKHRAKKKQRSNGIGKSVRKRSRRNLALNVQTTWNFCWTVRQLIVILLAFERKSSLSQFPLLLRNI